MNTAALKGIIQAEAVLQATLSLAQPDSSKAEYNRGYADGYDKGVAEGEATLDEIEEIVDAGGLIDDRSQSLPAKVSEVVEIAQGRVGVPKMAIAYFPVALNIPSNGGTFVVDFSKLYVNMRGCTYTWSFDLYRNSQGTDASSLGYIGNSLSVLGRVSNIDQFDYNAQAVARTSPSSSGGPFSLNVARAFTDKSITNGVVKMMLDPSTEMTGDWIGIFACMVPWTDEVPTNQITICPENFLMYEEA